MADEQEARLASWVREHCDCCWTRATEEGGCKLVLPRRGRSISLSGTLYQKNHGHPGPLGDHMIFWSSGADERVAAVELKSKRPSLSKVQKQLQNAADVIHDITRERSEDMDFAAAVLHKGLDSISLKALGSRKIRFRGRKYRIQPKRCGSSLESLYPS